MLPLLCLRLEFAQEPGRVRLHRLHYHQQKQRTGRILGYRIPSVVKNNHLFVNIVFHHFMNPRTKEDIKDLMVICIYLYMCLSIYYVSIIKAFNHIKSPRWRSQGTRRASLFFCMFIYCSVM